jgi:para-aminobenzoate synthetase / 4-amino-4-deoxychorismate lyase
MYATKADGPRYLDRHLTRLASSAKHFGFSVNTSGLAQELLVHCREREEIVPYRLRAAVKPSGNLHVAVSQLTTLNSPVADVMLAVEYGLPCQWSLNEFLFHKGTIRSEYDRAWRMAEQHGAFDMLFLNERGELTEGGRSNIFMKIDGRWWTPPVASGLLPGVMRSVLLEDPWLMAEERVLKREDLDSAEELMVCNALRGAIQARIRPRLQR